MRSIRPLRARPWPLLLLTAACSIEAAAGAAGPARALPERIVSDAGWFEIRLDKPPKPVPLNELFELLVEVHPARAIDDLGAIQLKVDATMPAHKHGMTTRPAVSELGNGRYRIRGMLLHMTGEWEISFDISKGRIHDLARSIFKLE